MRHRLDFTYDEVRFKGLPEFVNELHDQGLHYIIILVSITTLIRYFLNGTMAQFQ